MKKTIGFTTLTIICLIIPSVVKADVSAERVFISPYEIQFLGLGEKFTIDVMVQEAKGVLGCNFILSYDSEFLKFVRAIAGDFWQGHNTAVLVDDAPGLLDVGVVILEEGCTEIDGSEESLAQVEFEVIKEVRNPIPLEFKEVYLSDCQMNKEIPERIDGGEVIPIPLSCSYVDVNGDRMVDIDDLDVVIHSDYWDSDFPGLPPPLDSIILPSVDVNRDGRVDINDLAIIIDSGYWGRECICGTWDIDGNGQVLSSDAAIVMKYAVWIGAEPPKGYPKFDVNRDGQVTDDDSQIILEAAVGLLQIPPYGIVYDCGTSSSQAPLAINSLSKVWLSAQNNDGYLDIDVKAHLTDTELYAYQFDLIFDQNSLAFISAEDGEILRLDGSDSYWNPVKVKAGSIKRILATRLGVKEGAKGEGSLAKFRFRVKDKHLAPGFLSIENLKLVAPESRLIKVDVSGNRISLERVVVPEKLALLQNYPNPFNPETWIPFELAQDVDVTINIYDTTGKLVRTFSFGRKSAGYYLSKDRAAYWDGRDSLGQKVASGVYYYTLQAGNFTATRKMVILK